MAFTHGRRLSMVTIIGNRLLVSEYHGGSLLHEIQSKPPGFRELWRSITGDRKHKKSLISLMTTP